jgi:type VI secretion system secreted protein VgrG
MAQDDVFALETDRLDAGLVEVVSFTGREAMNAGYGFEIVARCPLDSDLLGSLEQRFLARPATLHLNAPNDAGRKVHGQIETVRLVGLHGENHAEIHATLVPRFTLTKLHRHSRIFQNRALPDVVSQVLDAWRIAHSWQLRQVHRPHPYLTQYQETDQEFVLRLLSAEGIMFYFEHPADEPAAGKSRERMVLLDDALFYPAMAGPTSGRERPSLEYGRQLVSADEDMVTEVSGERTLTMRSVRLGDYDFRKPTLPLRDTAQVGPTPSSPGIDFDTELLGAYLHDDEGEYEASAAVAEFDNQRAARSLEQLRRDRDRARGRSHCRRLMPGSTFELRGHPIEQLNRPYVVTEVEHRGVIPERGGSGQEPSYENRFGCAPAGQSYRPALPPGRPHQVAETATVVGPGDEPLYVDDLCRIKVQFHWDLEGKHNEQSSCWLRVAQPWAGTRFGMQLLPRVGMEVLVTFLGGNVDRPVVTGCLYNATHPPPFQLPDEKARSGLRTQTLAGEGLNELSFNDEAGAEQIFLGAQRDLDQRVGRNHTLFVEGDELVTVAGEHRQSVGGSLLTEVAAHLHQTVAMNHSLTVQGDTLAAVSGSADVRVSADRTTRVEGCEQAEIRGRADESFLADRFVRVTGHQVTLVGKNDARRSAVLHVEGENESSSTGRSELSSDKVLVLRCGESQIRLLPDAIEIASPTIRLTTDELYGKASKLIKLQSDENALVKAKKLQLKGEKAQVGLSQLAKVDGEMVKLNCGPDPIDAEMPDAKPIPPTTIRLAAEDGTPLVGQRFVVVLPDGSERSGVTGEGGAAELELEQDGTIWFPNVDKARPG